MEMTGPLRHFQPAENIAAGNVVDSTDNGLVTSVVRTWPELAALATEWNDLLRKSRADTIFLTWEWLWSWVRATGQTRDPFVIVVRDDQGALVGVAPFYATAYRLLKLIPYRVLRLMADYPTGAEYPDWIARRDHEAEVLAAIAGVLSAHRRCWDAVWMPNIAAWSGAHERLERACRGAGLDFRSRPVPFSRIELPKGGGEYLGVLSANMRSALRRQARKIMGSEDVVVDQCSSVESLPEYLQALFALHHRRWKLKGEEGVFRRKPAERLFYEHFAAEALKAGWLRLYALRDHGAIKAVQIGYVYNNTFHLLQEGFDPDYLDGAGNVLRLNVIESCIRDGIAQYDFLGGTSEHKHRWQAAEREGCDVVITNPGMKGRFLFRRGIWPTGRFLRPAADLGAAGKQPV